MTVIEFNLSDGTIRPESGRCWVIMLPDEVPFGDTSETPTHSAIEVFEDGRKLGPAHTPHDDVRLKGGGSYSHWGSQLYFSTSDNSDPRSSGKRYTIRATPITGTRERLSAALESHQLDRHNYPNLAPADFTSVVEIVESVLDRVLSITPEAERGAEITRICKRLDGLKGVLFEDMNGFFRRAPKFETAVEEYQSRFRNGCAIHLELGSYVAWPDARVEQYITQMALGDMIRLDMNLAFKPDVAGNVAALPFADESIDIISSNSLFEHVAYPHEIIRESFRVLRPGGLMLTTVPFHFVAHGCPNDYLRYTGEFFQEVCSRTGFELVLSDTWGTSGPYYTAHQLLKGVLAADPKRDNRLGNAAQITHLAVLMLLGALQPFDDYFEGGGPHHYHATRMLAVKAGPYRTPKTKPDRSKSIIDRFPYLICPASGLPLRRSDDALISMDGRHRYEIEGGIPNLFTDRGFGSHFDVRASSRAKLAEWQRSPLSSSRILRALRKIVRS